MVKKINICILLGAMLLCIPLSTAVWYDANWQYRQEYNISNIAQNRSNYQVVVEFNSTTVPTDFDWNNNAEDVRFTSNNGTGLLYHYRESYSSGTLARFLVKVPYVSNTSDIIIYMYYGNDDATTTSDLNAYTFASTDLYGNAEYNSWTKSGCGRSSSTRALIAINGQTCVATKALPEQINGGFKLKFYGYFSTSIVGLGLGTGDVANKDYYTWEMQYYTTGDPTNIGALINKYDNTFAYNIANTTGNNVFKTWEWQYATFLPNGTMDFEQITPDYYTVGTDTSNIYTSFDYMRITMKDLGADPQFRYIYVWKYMEPEPVAVKSVKEDRPPIPPTANNFGIEYGTTNFSALSHYNNVTNLALATINGKIQFPSSSIINIDGSDLDSNIEIGNGFVSVNTLSLHTSFNSTANITLSNVDCTSPVIYKADNGIGTNSIEIQNNGNTCTDCIINSCINGTINFQVNGFSDYAPGSPPIVQAYIAPPLVYANTNITGLCYVNDSINNTVNLTYTWYRNGAQDSTGLFTNVTLDANTSIPDVDSSSISQGDNWTLFCEAFDGGNYTNSSANTTAYNMPEPTYVNVDRDSYEYLVNTVARISINESQWNYTGPTSFDIDYYNGTWINIVEFNATYPQFSWVSNTTKRATGIDDMVKTAFRSNGIDIGDINSDGLDDIVYTTAENTNKIKIFINNGTAQNPIFVDYGTQWNLVSQLSSDGDMALVDFNNDGLLDVFAVADAQASGQQHTYFYENQGNSTHPIFVNNASCNPITYTGLTSQGGRVESNDFDGDGIIDVIYNRGAQASTQRGISIYYMDGNCGVKSSVDVAYLYSGLPDERSIDSYDFDYDGDFDFSIRSCDIAGTNSEARFYLNIGDENNMSLVQRDDLFTPRATTALASLTYTNLFPEDNLTESIYSPGSGSGTTFSLHNNIYDNSANNFFSVYNNWDITSFLPGTYDIRASATYQETTSDFTIGNITIELGDIDSCLKLQAIPDTYTGNITVVSDIDCTDTINWNSGQGFEPILNFSGIFEGNNYIITGLYINRSSTDYIGLFDILKSNAHVQNLTLRNSIVVGQAQTGTLVGQIEDGDIFNIEIYNGTVIGNGNSIGGVIGSNLIGNMRLTRFEGSVTSTGNNVGGIIGSVAARRNPDTIYGNFVNATIFGDSNVGGVVGYSKDQTDGANSLWRTLIYYSEVHGTITGTGNSVGGVIGYGQHYSLNTNSRVYYSTVYANVTGFDQVGGISGYCTAGISSGNRFIITQGLFVGNVVATDNVSVDYLGAIVGRSDGSVECTAGNSYWDTNYMDSSVTLGVGAGYVCTSCYGESTLTLFDNSTYTWDFATLWNILDDRSYPWVRYLEPWSIRSPTIFNLTHISPVPNLITDQPLNVSFRMIDSDDATLSCSLYVDGNINLTNSSVLNNTVTYFAPTLTTGIHTYYVRCTDGTLIDTTDSQYILFDNEHPIIRSEIPTLFNNTIYNGYSMNFIGNITNLNISNINITIYRPNGSIYYNQYNNSPNNVTFWPWDYTFNTSVSDNGNWSMYISTEDHVGNFNDVNIAFKVANCIPNWVCTSYDTCDGSVEACTVVQDSNVCGLPFTGSLSTYDIVCSLGTSTGGSTTGGGCPNGLIEFNSMCIEDTLMRNIVFNDFNNLICEERRTFIRVSVTDKDGENLDVDSVRLILNEDEAYEFEQFGDYYIFDELITLDEDNQTAKIIAFDTILDESYSISSEVQLIRGDCGVGFDMITTFATRETADVANLFTGWSEMTNEERTEAVKENYFTLLIAIVAAIWLGVTIFNAFKEGRGVSK